MATVETLQVRFEADMSRLSAQLNQLAGQIAGLHSALGQGKASIAGSAAGMIRSVGEALLGGAAALSEPEEAGSAISARFAGSIAQGAGASLAAAQLNAGAARFDNAAALAGAIGAGAALGQGFASGIASQYGAVMAAANRIASAAVSRIRSALRIHSPSRVSYALGGNFGEGFAQGVQASLRGVENSVQALSAVSCAALNPAAAAAAPSMDGGGISDLVQRAVQDALGGVNLVLPLHVDGIKLGEASIRGINQVTRSAGRLMLEI